jgi:Ca2+-binding RTX toxin-like protein
MSTPAEVTSVKPEPTKPSSRRALLRAGLGALAATNRRSLKASATIVLATALAAATALATPAPVAARSVTCDYNPSNHRVTVTMTGDAGTRIQRTRFGRIKVAGNWCDGATVTNTDTIVVTGGTGNQTLNLSLRNGGFKPGWTNEPEKSDEIEFSVSFGAGSDRVVVEAYDYRQHRVDFGRLDTIFGTFRLINLNADENPSADADVVMTGIDTASYVGFSDATDWRGSDVIHGGESFYMDAFDLPLHLFGGAGPDALSGGTANDRIYAGAGNDSAWGAEGNDYIDVRDGVKDNDAAYGGPGTDTCLGDLADIFTCETVITSRGSP